MGGVIYSALPVAYVYIGNVMYLGICQEYVNSPPCHRYRISPFGGYEGVSWVLFRGLGPYPP